VKFLYLGTPSYVQEYLQVKGDLTFTSSKLDPSLFKKFDWIISYGYTNILTKEHIDAAKNPIINLHISYLPFNRGFSPNYWSWVKQTPKGVTIHQIDEGLDTGPIYIQKEVDFSGNETLSSSYLILKLEIEKLFIQNFDKIIIGNIKPYKQVGGGSYQAKKDLPKNIDWNEYVSELI
jgi:methionyl-tRNA formyltransferase